MRQNIRILNAHWSAVQVFFAGVILAIGFWMLVEQMFNRLSVVSW